jgi:hypothetical protein
MGQQQTSFQCRVGGGLDRGPCATDLTVVRLVESKHRNQRKMVGPRLG